MNYLLLIVLCTCFATSEQSLYAQNEILLKEFTDSTMFNFVGKAQLYNKRIRLTEAKTFQGGGIWLKDKKNVANDFAIEIGFQITNSDAAGADGIAFVIQNNSAFSIGQFGGGIGYSSIPNAIAIEFDTYYNPERNDPNDNHISIQSSGKNPISENHIFSLGMASNIPIMEDGNQHTLRIEYMNKIFNVYLDDMNKPRIIAYVNVDSLLQLDNGTAWLGFTSSTGGSYGNHDIVSFGHSNGIIANAGKDTILCLGKQVKIGETAFGRAPFTYSWTPSLGLSDDSIAQPWANPKTTTTYIVNVQDTLGNIDIDSVTIIVDTCSALLILPEKKANILDTVLFPAIIFPSVNLLSFDSTLYSYTAYLHYASTILYPLSVYDADLSHTFANNQFAVKVHGLYNPKLIDTLFTLHTLAVFGNDTSTQIIIDSVHWEDKSGNPILLDIAYINGAFTLQNLCDQGGIRLLFGTNTLLQIKQVISPDHIFFDIQSTEDGLHSFQLYDVHGALLDNRYWQHIASIPRYFGYNPQTLSNGMYIALLKSPQAFTSYTFLIHH